MRRMNALNGAGRMFAIAFFSAVLFSGCSAIVLPNPEDVVKHPLGTESIKVGMTKEQVEDIWGRPSQVKTVEDKAKWQGSREVWIYRAQYGSIPVDAGYLSSTKKLYFDGNNLTEIGE
ncbi:MAG: outer membrane protein assembly factor BamE [Candidatus Omnitrophica bacterium]|nr:outer membrane protein assembly factor BamE [Candidatus Omnitrophota bacterium]